MHRPLIIALAALLLAACQPESATPTAPAAPTPPATATTPAATQTAANVQVWVDDLDLTKGTQDYNPPPKKNLSAENNPITLKGKTFTHAIGTHANGLIVINLKGAAKSFSATVGVDDDAADEGSVGFHVIGDGKELAYTHTINRQDPVQHIKVDLTGLQQLVLQVDSGDDDNINNDHADWAEPLITLDPARAQDCPETIPADQAKLPK